jgi:uncharacterized protein (DUF1778 family)
MGSQTVSSKTERLGLRTTEAQRHLLAAASRAEGVSVTDFVLTHATRAAENVLADRKVFFLDEDAWAAFEAALDRPAREISGLRDLMKRPSVLEQED